MKQNYIHFPFEQSILWSCASKPLLGIRYRKQRREEQSSLMLSAYRIWQRYHHFKHTAPVSGLRTNGPELHTATSECTICSCTPAVFYRLVPTAVARNAVCLSDRERPLKTAFFWTESACFEEGRGAAFPRWRHSDGERGHRLPTYLPQGLMQQTEQQRDVFLTWNKTWSQERNTASSFQKHSNVSKHLMVGTWEILVNWC